jgi:lipoprotein-releasing system permease protein
MNLFIAYRFLFSRYNLSFISIISKVSIIGLMLGVAILITVLSVMNGFEKELRDKILGFTSHVNIYPHNNLTSEQIISMIKSHEKIVSYSFVNRDEELISSDSVSNYPIIFNSISSYQEKLTSNIADMIIAGDFTFKEPSDVIIGTVLAKNLNISIGDKISIVNYKKNFKNNIMTVKGIFDSGINEYNARFVYGNKSNYISAEDFSYVKLRLKDALQAPFVSKDLFHSHSLITSNWTETHNALFQAINNEKRVMFIILTLIIAIAAFNIISSLSLLVMNKQKDIAILISIGLTTSTIRSIFLMQGIIIGLVGISLGVILGLLLSININEIVMFVESIFNISIISPDIYHLDKVPHIILKTDIYNIILITSLLVLLSSIYPAMKASRKLPIQSLNI